VTFSGSSVFGAATGLATTGAGLSIKFRDGTVVSALGQGSAGLAHGRHPQSEEEEALRTGLSVGMTLIDTESYGSEELIGRVIGSQRDRVFLVSKVSANHVGGNGIARACEASLTRLRTDYLDLYLLHWPNGITDYAGQRRYAPGGVSNFNVTQLEKLFRVPQGDRCATNQVAYSLFDRATL
jgi:diketogulonate reductase-like aldo/keto reductase